MQVKSIAECSKRAELQNAPREHSAILSTFIKLLFVFKTFLLSIFELALKTGFTVSPKVLNVSFCDHWMSVVVIHWAS